MNLLNVTNPLQIYKYRDLDSVQINDDISATIAEPSTETLASEEISFSLRTKIRSQWFYKNFPIFLTDSNEVQLVKLAIKQTKKDLKNILKKINALEDANEDVVPKRQYELILRKYKQLAYDLNNFKKNFNESYDKFRELEVEHTKLIVERDRLFNENERTKLKLTPRPNWSKCANYYSGGADKWKSLCESLTSNELVDVLLNEFIGGNDGTNTKHELSPLNHIFNTKSKSYQNMKLSKRDVLLLVNDILIQKSNYDNARNSKDIEREKLKNFLYVYFRKKYQSSEMALKWYYNLIDAVERFNYEENVKFFEFILNEVIDENIYHYYKKITNDLYELFRNDALNNEQHAEQQSLHEYQFHESARNSILSVSVPFANYATNSASNNNVTNCGTDSLNVKKTSLKLSRQNFVQILKQKFPDIKPNDIKTFLNAAKTDLFSKSKKLKAKAKMSSFDELFDEFEMFDFTVLFQISDDGTLTEFLNKLKLYLNKERNNYIIKFLKEIYRLKNFVITANAIKIENADIDFGSEIANVELKPPEIAVQSSEAKVKKHRSKTRRKLKKFKKKLKSKISLLGKKSKRKLQKITKKINENKTNEIELETSNSVDLFDDYNIDIKDTTIYNQLITIDEFKNAIINIDPKISIIDQQCYIEWVFKSDDSFKKAEIKLGKLIKMMQKLNCYLHE